MEPIDPPWETPDGAIRAALGAGQPEYRPLPAFIYRGVQGRVATFWKPSPEELATILRGGSIAIEVLTFGGALQPLDVWVPPLGEQDNDVPRDRPPRHHRVITVEE
jgi:hypothetical protein